MNITKLPSGSYRIKQMEGGKLYSVTVPYKPSQKDAFKLIQDKINQRPLNDVSFYKASLEYTETKRNVLSERTIREYKKYPDRLPKWFTDMSLYTISQYDIQKCINELSEKLSPKTVRCLHGFISAVFGLFRPEMNISTTLPQNVKNEPIIPQKKAVKKLLQYTDEKAPHFYVGLFLSAYGLRRSELCALTLNDLKGNVLTISKALVEDENNNWINKTTKTTESTRQIVIPQQIADRIRQQGYIYPFAPQSLGNYLTKAEKELNIEHFSLHKLRHYFVSELSAMGVPDADIMALGGWSSDYTMKRIYRHSLQTEEKKKKISDKLSSGLM